MEVPKGPFRTQNMTVLSVVFLLLPLCFALCKVFLSMYSNANVFPVLKFVKIDVV